MTQALTEFFKEKRDRSSEFTIDWDRRREQWIAAINSLYLRVAEFLVEPLRQKTVSLAQRPREITEDHLGTYEASDLILTVGDERVRFVPRARNVYGASGRVDVLGERGEATLVADDAGRWAVVPPGRPRPKSVPLNAETFAEVLRSVMRP